MKVRKSRGNPHTKQFMIDLAHVIIGAAVIVLGIYTFAAPMKRMFTFPLIFGLAGLLNLINGVPRLCGRFRNKRRLSGTMLCVMGVVLFILAFISAVSLWR